MRSLPLLALSFVLVATVFAQTFEISSIKPGSPDVRESLNTQPNGRFVATSVTLKMLIGYAYSVRDISYRQLRLATGFRTVPAGCLLLVA